MKRKGLRTAATFAVALALIVGVLSFAPTRALARQFLSLFRVERFAVVRVDADQQRLEGAAQSLESIFGDQQATYIEDNEPVAVASLDEASARAGFEVRMPDYMPGNNLHFQVKDRTEVSFELKPDSLRMLFELAEMDPALVPADMKAGDVTGIIPAMVLIATDQVTVAEVLEPTIEYPDNVDPAMIGEAGLRLLGVDGAEAARLSRSVDWGSTLLLPVPTQLVEVRETVIGGEQAVLLIPVAGEGQQTIMVQKDGLIYIVSGRGAYDRLAEIAESLF